MAVATQIKASLQEWRRGATPVILESLTKTVIILGSLAAFSPLGAAIEFWRGYLVPELAFSSEYTSNARSGAQGGEDWINTFSPSIQYDSFGSTWATQVGLGMDIVRYTEQEREDENVKLSASLNYPNGISLPYSFSLSTSINDTTRGDPEFGRITRTRRYSLSNSGSYNLTSRYTLSSGFSYSLNQPLDESNAGGRSDTTSFSVPVNFNYKYSEALSYGLGYQFGQQESNASVNASETTTHALFGNVSGQILPLVSAELSLGAQMAQSDAGSDTGPYASGGLTWQATSLTSVSLNLSAGFQTTTGNRTGQQFTLNTIVNHQFAHNLSGNLSAGIRTNDYSSDGDIGDSDRKDRSWDIGAGLSTSIYEHTRLSLSLNYQSNDSDQAGSQFDAYSIRVSASRPF